MRESLEKAGIPPRWQIVMAFAAVYLIWGSTYLGIHLAVETIPPFSMAGSRALVAGALLYIWARGRGAARPEAIHWREAAIVGGFLLLGGNGLLPTAAFDYSWSTCPVAATMTRSAVTYSRRNSATIR